MPDFTFSIAVGCSDGSVSVWLLAVDEDSVDGILVAFANIMTRLTCLCATHIDTVMEDDEIEEAPEPLPRKEKRQQSSKDEEKTVERSQANDDSSKAAKNGEKKKRKRQPKLSVSKHE
ncbi:hypothetical protein BLNAU_3585 [Blattamonas nauphoetae]|uniref:Uncharacterized protein n=1 Tax=Blattamonas nauphoetae TaxID=2049346 RepID=A0ABQ9YCK7_9EUKA|nr:hypothetical protein BLNAU_3585 [Blattamonas nauphoetae]